MDAKQAKDFLVAQAAEQARLDSVPLSDVEKRMMYFTESDPTTCANPIELNEEFEAKYETAEYERKISRLLHRAYDRLKAESSEARRNWDDAVRTLRRGDHYLLVLWDVKPVGERPKGDSLKLWGTGLLVTALLVTASFLAEKYHIDEVWVRGFWEVLILVVVLVPLARPLYRRAVVRFYQRRDRKVSET